MKVLKIILGVILTYAIIKGGIELSIETPSDSVMYIVISIFFLLMPILLFRSALKDEKDDYSELEKKEINKIK